MGRREFFFRAEPSHGAAAALLACNGHQGWLKDMDRETNTGSAATAGLASLVERIRAGESAAEAELYTAYSRGVFLIATVRTRDSEAARDLTQDVFLAVLAAVRAGQLREAEKLPAFIQGTARNLINNFLRSRTHRAECDLPDAELLGGDLVDDLELAERRRLVHRELESCAPQDRKLLVWSLLEGHSLADIARRLNLSHEAVRARKSRLVKKIGEKLAGLSHRRHQ
ncbi:MAG TPA: sigma-70 family RNA polymerase sigma factor [Candidatus Angelobacter sp.]|jgi:RNA polymerase sigma-70 factor (ECF subfamily)